MNNPGKWKAGFGKRDITPEGSHWLAGFGARDRPSESVLHPISAKAFAVTDSWNSAAVVVSVESVGCGAGFSENIQRRAAARFDIAPERIFVNVTHTHSAPLNLSFPTLVYPLMPEDRKKAAAYTEVLENAVVEAIGDALDDQEDAVLEFQQGLAGIGVNRRRARPGGRRLPGPVDHDVPALIVRNLAGHLKGVVFGYACHTTVLFGDAISGDYAGVAQTEIEFAYPGAVAMFVPGCAGDINPLPRGTVARAEMHGRLLAEAVCDLITEPGVPLEGPLRFARGQAELLCEQIPTPALFEQELASQVPLEKWVQRLRAAEVEGSGRSDTEILRMAEDLASNRQEEIRSHVQRLTEKGQLRKSQSLPLGILDFGSSLRWIHLGGEPVVDYSLLLKERYGWEQTWVSGYSHEVGFYVPSARVLQEGGYEGAGAMLAFGCPGRFTSSIEQTVLQTLENLRETLEAARP